MRPRPGTPYLAQELFKPRLPYWLTSVLAMTKRSRGRPPGPGRGRGRPPSAKAAGAEVDAGHIGAVDVAAGSPAERAVGRIKAMDPFNPMVAMVSPLFVPSSEPLRETVIIPALEKLRQDGLGLEVRMVKLSDEQIAQVWPQQLEFFANGVRMFSVAQRTDGHKRRDFPKSLSEGIGLRPGRNELAVNLVDADRGDFAMAVVTTRPRSVDDLCQEVSSACARRFVVAWKAEGGDGGDVMCLSSSPLRLRCPITMERMHDPVRGAACQHLQCFGLHAYLQSNRQMSAFNQRWVCPICSLVLRPADLRRDAYVERVLAETSADVDEVVVDASGTWMPAARRRCLPIDVDAIPTPMAKRCRVAPTAVEEPLPLKRRRLRRKTAAH